MEPIKNLDEQVFVNKLRAQINKKSSSIIDSLSGWLIGGFAAASALLVSQYDSVSKHIEANELQLFLYLFMSALVCAVIQKLISTLVISNSMGSSVGAKLGKEAANNSQPLNFDFILKEIENSMLPIAKCYAIKSFQKVKNGDLVSSSRNFTRLCQVQGLLVISQAIITLVAIYNLARAFHA